LSSALPLIYPLKLFFSPSRRRMSKILLPLYQNFLLPLRPYRRLPVNSSNGIDIIAFLSVPKPVSIPSCLHSFFGKLIRTPFSLRGVLQNNLFFPSSQSRFFAAAGDNRRRFPPSLFRSPPLHRGRLFFSFADDNAIWLLIFLNRESSASSGFAATSASFRCLDLSETLPPRKYPLPFFFSPQEKRGLPPSPREPS